MTVCDKEVVVEIGGDAEPLCEPLHEVRVTPGGRVYRVPPFGKKVVDLEEDCGVLLNDIEFLRNMPGVAQMFTDDGNLILNAEWKKKNLIPFRRPWRPSFQLPK